MYKNLQLQIDLNFPTIQHFARGRLNRNWKCQFIFFFTEQACKASDIVNVVAKLSKAKHLLKVEDLHG